MTGGEETRGRGRVSKHHLKNGNLTGLRKRGRNQREGSGKTGRKGYASQSGVRRLLSSY